MHILEYLDDGEYQTSAYHYTTQENLMLLIQPELYLLALSEQTKIMII